MLQSRYHIAPQALTLIACVSNHAVQQDFCTSDSLLQVLVTYGTRVLSLPQPQDPYGAKYKGIWICLLILARALGGTYVNFGVFELYGDPALRVSATRLAMLRSLVSQVRSLKAAVGAPSLAVLSSWQ